MMGYHIPPPISVQFLNDFRVTSSWQEMVHTVQRPTKETLFPSGQENGIRKRIALVEIEHPVNHFRDCLLGIQIPFKPGKDHLFHKTDGESECN